jgi:hypothetical protein
MEGRAGQGRVGPTWRHRCVLSTEANRLLARRSRWSDCQRIAIHVSCLPTDRTDWCLATRLSSCFIPTPSLQKRCFSRVRVYLQTISLRGTHALRACYILPRSYQGCHVWVAWASDQCPCNLVDPVSMLFHAHGLSPSFLPSFVRADQNCCRALTRDTCTNFTINHDGFNQRSYYDGVFS